MKLEGDSSLHFVSLRMTDTCVFEEGVVGGTASNNPLLPLNSLDACHSERSEESHTFSRSVLKNYKMYRQLAEKMSFLYNIVALELNSSQALLLLN